MSFRSVLIDAYALLSVEATVVRDPMQHTPSSEATAIEANVVEFSAAESEIQSTSAQLSTGDGGELQRTPYISRTGLQFMRCVSFKRIRDERHSRGRAFVST